MRIGRKKSSRHDTAVQRILCSQHMEHPVTIIDHPYRCRYGYARAEETVQQRENGQDFLGLHLQGNGCSFVLCDGVSMSYQGDFAARFLGEQLLGWLADLGAPPSEQAFHAYIGGLTGPATKAVEGLPIPHGTPQLLREVLEEKRRRGSESMFICGRIERASRSGLRKGRLWLAWQGDCRLRLWVNGSEVKAPFQDKIRIGERWSTLTGPVGGAPHLFTMELPRSGTYRLLCYTDGLRELDGCSGTPSDSELQRMLDQPQGGALTDDASFIEVSW